MTQTISLEEARKRHTTNELLALIDDIDPIALHGKPIPPRRWLVPGLIPWGNVTLLGGDGGLGKSLLMLQLQVASATGSRWLGRQVQAIKSYGFYCEDDSDEIHRRLDDICRHDDVTLGDLECMRATARVGENNILAAPSGKEGVVYPLRLYDALLAKCRGFGAQLLIIDTVADAFGGNENYRSQVRTFIGLLRRIARDIDGAVVLTAHPSQAGLSTGHGFSGSTAWNNSVRSQLYLTRPKNADSVSEPQANERILRSMKSNYAGIAGDIALTWQDGVFVAEEAPEGMLLTISNRNADRKFLECLDAAIEQGRTLSDSNRVNNYAPKIMLKMPHSEGVKKRDLEQAMERLFARNEIKIGTPITGKDRHKRRGFMRTKNNA